MREQGEAVRRSASAEEASSLVRILRAVARVTGWCVIAAVLVPVVVRLTGWELGPLAIVVSAVPWVTLVVLVPVVLAIAARAWQLLAASSAVLMLCLIWMAPFYVSEPATGEPQLRVATLSLASGTADGGDVVAMVRDHDVDVLVLTELTARSLRELERAGLDAALPYSWRNAPDDRIDRKSGTGLWSRIPLEDPEALRGFSATTIRAQIELGEEPLTVIAVHPESPNRLEHVQWQQDLEALHDVLEAHEGPVLVAGDFNASFDHRLFRDIVALGYVDAADQAGAGFIPTFPRGDLEPQLSGIRTVFSSPLVVIDHVLVRDAGLTATRVDGVEVLDSDHRGLVVEYSGE
ncbi:endonuclease/exonuclease/phosphatase family protein [Demequina iriomotensis]|uniref:endonuclease/exonuclease/phosphatase family protein n=1 Tax=Demequina iriomotensis TaxID=1536641 RepID=UPI0009E564DB|nr:endonuclease/exonuclease/phosphatase family protein [Demequina iriomotensis]